jgi:hypothetical protein
MSWPLPVATTKRASGTSLARSSCNARMTPSISSLGHPGKGAAKGMPCARTTSGIGRIGASRRARRTWAVVVSSSRGAVNRRSASGYASHNSRLVTVSAVKASHWVGVSASLNRNQTSSGVASTSTIPTTSSG